jgi:hypothetical protein
MTASPSGREDGGRLESSYLRIAVGGQLQSKVGLVKSAHQMCGFVPKIRSETWYF